MTENSHQLPQSWAITSLAGVATLINGDRGKNYPSKDKLAEKGFPFVNAGHLEGGLIKSEGMNFIDQKRFDLLNGGKFIPGDILFCIRGSLGKVAVNKNIEKGAIASSLIIARPTPLVDGFFVFCYLSSPLAFDMIRRYDNGTAQPNLSGADLARFEFPLPSRSEQHRIVEKIETLFSELDKGIESLKTAREQLKVYRQAVLKNAFEGKLTAQWRKQNKDKLETPQQLLASIQQERQARYQQQLKDWQADVKVWETNDKEGKKPGRPRLVNAPKINTERDFEVPAEWELMELGTLAFESILGKMLDKAKNIGLARPYLGNINVRWGAFNLDNLKSMKIEESEVERYSLESGDIVICEGGEPGRCAVWQNTGTPVFIQKALHRVRFTESYSSRFAFYYLTYSTPLERVIKHFTGTTIKHLTGTGLNKVQFPVCSLEEQLEIVNILEEKLSLIESLESEIYRQLKKSETLRQSILKKAFSGKLVPQDPNDEPASALLAQIHAEKATHAVSASKTTNKKLANPRNKEVRDD